MLGQDTAPQLKPRTVGPAKIPPGGTDRQIILDVQVTDRSGAPVRGLQQQDFTLLGDKQPKNILSFHAVEISEMSDLQVRMHGNTGVVTGAYYKKGTGKGKSYEYRDRFTDVWMNINGRWRVIASHYSLRANP